MNRVEELEARVRSLGSCIVAFSGGVDSSLVAALAARALGERALAVTAVSPALATGELDGAREVARVIGAWDRILEERPGQRVAIGCHGGVIGVLAAHVTGVPQQWAFANPPFASFSRVVIAADGRAQVLSLNEVGHFDATRRRVIGPDGEEFEGKGFMQALAESRT